MPQYRTLQAIETDIRRIVTELISPSHEAKQTLVLSDLSLLIGALRLAVESSCIGTHTEENLAARCNDCLRAVQIMYKNPPLKTA